MLGLRDEKMIFGVDRLDYTKGIPDRLKAFARLLEQHPEWRDRVTMVQVGAPSRDHLKSLSGADERSARTASTTSTRSTAPMAGCRSSIARSITSTDQVARMYRAADVCVVSSLHDGMNLVAKEFIASRNDEHGVLVLSRIHRRGARARPGRARQSVRGRCVCRRAASGAVDARGRSAAPHARAARSACTRNTVFDWASSLLLAAACRRGPVMSRGAVCGAASRDAAPIPLHHGVDRQRPRARPRSDPIPASTGCACRGSTVPSVFARLLDQERGGTWSFKPVEDWRATAGIRAQHQRDAHRSGDDRRPLRDLRLRAAHPAGPQGRRADRDVPAAAAALGHAARPGALRSAAGLRARRGRGRGGGHRARSGGRPDPVASRLERAARRTCRTGRRFASIARCSSRSAPASRRRSSSAPEAENALEQTIRGWRAWAKTTALPSFAPEAVLRSALCLKLHAYQRHRRDHCRGHDQHARSARLGPHLGLPLLLAARCRLRRRGAAAA